MKIVLYGRGCQKCIQLLENVQAALDKLNIHADIEKISDMEAITKANLPARPALEIDGKIVAAGQVPTVEEFVEILDKRESPCSCGCNEMSSPSTASCCCEKEQPQEQKSCCCSGGTSGSCCSKPSAPGKRLLIYIFLTILGLATAIVLIGKFN